MCGEKVVLLIDDDVNVREVIALLLTSAGAGGRCTVMQAADGRAGLVLARTRRPDVIVSDVEMPVMDGVELLEQLRHDAELGDVPVVLVSGRADLAKVARASGADAHAAKPLELRRLLDAIAEAQRARGGSRRP